MDSVQNIYSSLKKQTSASAEGILSVTTLIIEDTIFFFGYDGIANTRSVFINIGEEGWEDDKIRALPKWSGVNVQVEWREKIGPVYNKFFLILTQGQKEYDDLFELVIQNLVDNVKVRNETDLFTTLFKVFERWKSFFKQGGFRRLTDRQQQGLIGELLFIKQWIESNPGQPPLLITSWVGPTKERIDFVGKKAGVEIKTTINKMSKTIRISNEMQLEKTNAVKEIILFVCYLEESKNYGITLDEIVKTVRNYLYQYSFGLALAFDELLYEVGYKNGEYNEKKYSVLKEEAYRVGESFPVLNRSSLPIGINQVSYNIDLSHCESYEIELKEVFKLF